MKVDVLYVYSFVQGLWDRLAARGAYYWRTRLFFTPREDTIMTSYFVAAGMYKIEELFDFDKTSVCESDVRKIVFEIGITYEEK